MKPEMQEITRGIGSLSPDSVRRLDRSFALSKDAQGRIYRKTLRKTGVREKAVMSDAAVSRRGIRLKKPVTAVVALLLALSIGAGAIVGAGRLSRSFSQTFRTLP